jgi:nucleolar protein 15
VSAPVAQIVAETMDNYLLMSHIMTCKVIPKDEVHPELWVGANRKWRIVPTYRLAQAQHNKVRSSAHRVDTDSLIWPLQPRNEMQQRAAEKRLLNRQEARKRKLAEAGIVYNFEKVGYVSTLLLY